MPLDQNTYILGDIGEQNVVIASLPSGAYGNTSATTVGMQLLSSFHKATRGNISDLDKEDHQWGDAIILTSPHWSFRVVSRSVHSFYIAECLLKRCA
jgi:hypothetical protein